MRERGWSPTTILAQRRRLRRPRHLFAVPRTSLQCVCTRRRNCIEQLSPSSKYAPGTGRFPARNSAQPQQKKPRDSAPGLLCLASSARSVLRDDRAAELVVRARGDEIDVLTDAVGADEAATRRGESVGTILHEQVIELDANRPVRGESVFEASADRATPAGVVAGDASERASNGVDAVAIRGHRSTALDVEQDVVDGIADLTGEQAERIDVRVVAEAGEHQARVAAREVGPVALGFKAEHPGASLPAIADLTTDRAAGRVMGTLRAKRKVRRNRIPGVAARTPAAVGTDVETGPVIHRSDHRGRLGVRTRSEIRSNSRRSRAERDQTGRNKQNLLHSFNSRSVLTAPKAVACS